MEQEFYKFHLIVGSVLENSLESLLILAQPFVKGIGIETSTFLLRYQWWLTQCLTHQLEFEKYDFSSDIEFQSGFKNLNSKVLPSIKYRAKVFYWTTRVKKTGIRYLQEFLLMSSPPTKQKESFGCPFAGSIGSYRKLSAKEVVWPDWVSHERGNGSSASALTVIQAPYIPKSCIESLMEQQGDQATVIFVQKTSTESEMAFVTSNFSNLRIEMPSQFYTDAINLFANALFTLGSEGMVESLGYLSQFNSNEQK